MSSHFSLTTFAGGVVVGIVLAVAWFYGNSFMMTPVSGNAVSTGTTTSTASAIPSSDDLSVLNQSAGMMVVIDSVTVPPPGAWIAVRDDEEGTLGNVLGAAKIGGPRSSISVLLLRATVSGQQYAVELYRDDEGTTFSPSDSVYVDSTSGQPAVAYFTAQ